MHQIIKQIQDIENEAIRVNQLLYATQSEKIDTILDLTLFRLDVRLDENSDLDLFEMELLIRNQNIGKLNIFISELRLIYDDVLESLDFLP